MEEDKPLTLGEMIFYGVAFIITMYIFITYN